MPPYPTGDSGASMAFGQTVFTQGLDDAQDKGEWQHHWYVENGNGAKLGSECGARIAVQPGVGKHAFHGKRVNQC